jgi:hypothetical protein
MQEDNEQSEIDVNVSLTERWRLTLYPNGIGDKEPNEAPLAFQQRQPTPKIKKERA